MTGLGLRDRVRTLDIRVKLIVKTLPLHVKRRQLGHHLWMFSRHD